MLKENVPRTIAGEGRTRVVLVDGQQLSPDLSQELWNHSPDGFNWGYGGSGPAQLALAIGLLYLDNTRLAVAAHQAFKWDFIACLSFGDDFNLNTDAVKSWFEAWLADHEEMNK